MPTPLPTVIQISPPATAMPLTGPPRGRSYSVDPLQSGANFTTPTFGALMATHRLLSGPVTIGLFAALYPAARTHPPAKEPAVVIRPINPVLGDALPGVIHSALSGPPVTPNGENPVVANSTEVCAEQPPANHKHNPIAAIRMAIKSPKPR